MKSSLIRCVRCKGRKKVFMMNGGYSYTNTGGVEIKCPLCLGDGRIKSLSQAVEEAKKATENAKKDKKKEKDFKNGESIRENKDTEATK